MMLFTLCSENSFLKIDRNDNTDQDELETLYNWNESTAKYHIFSKIKDPLVRSLLLKLLNKDPQDRPVAMAQILEDPFFNPKSIIDYTEVKSQMDRIEMKFFINKGLPLAWESQLLSEKIEKL